MNAGVTFGSEYVMRIVLWCVSMFWAAMVWRGECAVCHLRTNSWHSHRWLEQIPFSIKINVATVIDHWNQYQSCLATVIDHWNQYQSNSFFSVLQNAALNCTTGTTCCGRPAALMPVFGCVLPTQGPRWPQPGDKTLYRPSESEAQAIDYFKLTRTPATSPASSPSNSPRPSIDSEAQSSADSSAMQLAMAVPAPVQPTARQLEERRVEYDRLVNLVRHAVPAKLYFLCLKAGSVTVTLANVQQWMAGNGLALGSMCDDINTVVRREETKQRGNYNIRGFR